MSKHHWYITQLLMRIETLKQMKINCTGGKAGEAYILLTYPEYYSTPRYLVLLLAYLSQLKNL
jgi:hypothetical protein